MACGLNDGRVAQPDDSLFAVTDFGAAMIGRFEFVRLCVTVNQRMRVIVVGLMQMLPRHHRGADEPRHERESGDWTPKTGRHWVIMTREPQELITASPQAIDIDLV